MDVAAEPPLPADPPPLGAFGPATLTNYANLLNHVVAARFDNGQTWLRNDPPFTVANTFPDATRMAYRVRDSLISVLPGSHVPDALWGRVVSSGRAPANEVPAWVPAIPTAVGVQRRRSSALLHTLHADGRVTIEDIPLSWADVYEPFCRFAAGVDIFARPILEARPVFASHSRDPLAELDRLTADALPAASALHSDGPSSAILDTFDRHALGAVAPLPSRDSGDPTDPASRLFRRALPHRAARPPRPA